MQYLPAPGMRAFCLALAGALALCVALACAACQSAAASPPKIGYDCGTVRTAEGVASTDPSRCLLDHYANCQAATLVYITMGVDTSDTHTISVTPQGSACAVADADVSSSFGGRTGRQDYHCVEVSQRQGPTRLTSSGLQSAPGPVIVVGCGTEGDLVLPAPAPPSGPLLLGTSCGWVKVAGGHTRDDAAGPEACFWHAYTTCQPATLDFEGDQTSAMPNSVLVLTIVPESGTCGLYVQVTDFRLTLRGSQNLFTCTALVRQSNRLEIPTCTEVGGGFIFAVVLPVN